MFLFPRSGILVMCALGWLGPKNVYLPFGGVFTPYPIKALDCVLSLGQDFAKGDSEESLTSCVER